VVPNCATCGIAVSWQPTVVGAATYCCLGCAEGGPCSCDYGRLPRAGEAAALLAPRGPSSAADPAEAARPPGARSLLEH
jgi:hypothetical protein